MGPEGDVKGRLKLDEPDVFVRKETHCHQTRRWVWLNFILRNFSFAD